MSACLVLGHDVLIECTDLSDGTVGIQHARGLDRDVRAATYGRTTTTAEVRELPGATGAGFGVPRLAAGGAGVIPASAVDASADSCATSKRLVQGGAGREHARAPPLRSRCSRRRPAHPLRSPAVHRRPARPHDRGGRVGSARSTGTTGATGQQRTWRTAPSATARHAELSSAASARPTRTDGGKGPLDAPPPTWPSPAGLRSCR